MSDDAEALGLLVVALRSRPQTVTELADAVRRPVDAVAESMRGLADRGLIGLDGEAIRYRRPDAAVLDRTRSSLDGATAELAGALEQARSLLEALPSLLTAWEESSTDEHALRLDVLHGPEAANDLWALQASRGAPRFADAVIPDATVLLRPAPERLERFRIRMATSLRRARLVLSVADATAPEAQELIRQQLAQGMRIRMTPAPPSWFWINDDEEVGIPLTWGEAWPTSVMAVRSRPIAQLLRWIFERTWLAAVPVGEPSPSWEPILRLMEQGMTMDAASRALGLSPRTGRRRVAQAMEHHGVNSLFALGGAWRDRRSHTPDGA